MRARAIAGALLAVAVASLLRAPIARVPFERDEGEYAYVAWRWLHGELPYRDVFDQKPPAVFAVYAAIEATLGTTPGAVHWTLQLWLCAAQLVLFALARRSLGTAAATAAALLFALATSDVTVLGNAANIEGFALLPLVAGVALARHAAARASAAAPAALCGACGAAALLFKPVTAPVVAFSLLLLTQGGARRPRSQRALQAAYFAAGAAACIVPVLLAFGAAGGLAALYDATVRFNVDYASAVALRDYPLQLRLALRDSARTLGLLYAAGALGVLANLLALRTGGGRDRLWILGWLVASFLAAAAGGYFRGHAFLYLAPPLALLAADGLAQVLRALPLPRTAAALGTPLAALATIAAATAAAPWYFGTSTPADMKARRIYGANPFADAPALAAFLAQQSAPDETIFVFGSEPELNVYARRRHASRYVLAYHYVLGPPDAVRARQHEVLGALRADPPRLVVLALLRTSLIEEGDTPRDLRQGLAALLRESYRPIARLVPGVRGPGRVDTSAAALAPWREAAPLEQPERGGEIVVFRRLDARGAP